jgi:hypothetical protein
VDVDRRQSGDICKYRICQLIVKSKYADFQDSIIVNAGNNEIHHNGSSESLEGKECSLSVTK